MYHTGENFHKHNTYAARACMRSVYEIFRAHGACTMSFFEIWLMDHYYTDEINFVNISA